MKRGNCGDRLMSRHWRCGNTHDWVGDLGALTYCPICGSADVYEVRGPLPEDQQPAAAPASAAAETSTLILPPPAAPDADRTWTQPLTDAAGPSDPSDETH